MVSSSAPRPRSWQMCISGRLGGVCGNGDHKVCVAWGTRSRFERVKSPLFANRRKKTPTTRLWSSVEEATGSPDGPLGQHSSSTSRPGLGTNPRGNAAARPRFPRAERRCSCRARRFLFHRQVLIWCFIRRALLGYLTLVTNYSPTTPFPTDAVLSPLCPLCPPTSS